MRDEDSLGKSSIQAVAQEPNNALQLTASGVRSCLATPRMINGRRPSVYGPIKTFPLRGIKDSPPYLHDGRLLT